MVEGIILAGGLSSRMGSDKAMLPLGEAPLIEYMKNILTRSGLTKIRMSGDKIGGIADIVPRSGPVGGICTMILTNMEDEGWLFVPVDMPLLQPETLQRLMQDKAADGACFETTPLPLFLRRSDKLLEHVADITAKLRNGENFSIRGFLQPLEINFIRAAKEQDQLANINTPEEWRLFLEQHNVSAH